MGAGASAADKKRQLRRDAVELRRRARAAFAAAARFEAAEAAERRVAAVLVLLTDDGWRLLVDRQWPGTRSANVDMILVGPGGVYVIDVKSWREPPEVVDGHLTAGGTERDDAADKVVAMSRRAEDVVSQAGLAPACVRPALVFTEHRVDELVGRVRLLGEPDVRRAMLGGPRRLSSQMVDRVAALLEEAYPAYLTPTLDEADAAVPAQRPVPAETEALFDRDELDDAEERAARAAPIERWMSYLPPAQMGLVRRSWNGPARISGPAGTGKTVVGLHRAAHLATRATGTILYLTFQNNLPRVGGELFRRMAPHLAGRVEFSSVHAWALGLLIDRGERIRLDRSRCEDAFSRAWLRLGRGSALAELDPNPGYWSDEIQHVIKGRNITAFDEYASVARHGRRTSLRPEHRRAVWRLYAEYQRLLRERGLCDFNDVLALALRQVECDPPRPAPAAVIVDEVQDLTLVGVRLLHALVGDAPNGLLLIGDGQQAVYPGGFRLIDAGIDIKGGRAQVLKANYRNAAAIWNVAVELVADDGYDDLDGPSGNGRREVDLTYHEGAVLRARCRDGAEHDAALLKALAELTAGPDGDGDRLASTAVLCSRRRDVERYRRLLEQARYPVINLDDYDGRPVPKIKIGTFRRVKGLEFKQVLLPVYDEQVRAIRRTGAERERLELARRQLFVAMTRARDTLWLGSIEDSVSGDEERPTR